MLSLNAGFSRVFNFSSDSPGLVSGFYFLLIFHASLVFVFSWVFLIDLLVTHLILVFSALGVSWRRVVT